MRQEVERIKLINKQIGFLYDEEKVREFLTSFDPLDRPERFLLKCSNCGIQPYLIAKKRGVIFAECECGETRLCKYKAVAVPLWNKSPKSIRIEYWKIPAFSIPKPTELDPKVLKDQAIFLRRYFELKLELAKLRRKLGLTSTNLKHKIKLRSFIMWTIFLQGEIKNYIKQS